MRFTGPWMVLIIACLMTSLAFPAISAAPSTKVQKTVRLSPSQLEEIRLKEIAMAAKFYTQIAFSKENQRKMRAQLPLSEKDFQNAMQALRPRFQTCMESGFEARLANAFDAQVLRKTMQSALSTSVAEPEKAKTVIPAFSATDAFCSGKIKIWLSGVIR